MSTDVTLTADKYSALFPDAYLPPGSSNIIFSYNSTSTDYKNGNASINSINFQEPTGTNTQILLDLTWLSNDRKPREYYYDPVNKFYYSYVGITSISNSEIKAKISCDYEIDANCFDTYPQNSDNHYEVIGVKKIYNDSLYEINVKKVGSPQEFNFKNMMKISKVKIPFKNTYCFSESMETSISKVREIKYDINPYGDVAFINSPISSRNATKDLSIVIESDENNNIYIPDKFRCSDNNYLYFEPSSAGASARIIKMR